MPALRLPSLRNWRVFAAGALALVAISGGLYWLSHRTPPASYVTTPAARGDVETTVAASGTVNPVVTVEVGTYVSGTITNISCDYNTEVRKGQLCAKIDRQPYSVVVQGAQADLANARAQLVKDEANAVYARLAHQRQDLLIGEQSTSQDAADAARNAFDQANAAVAVDKAVIQQKAASLRAAEVNLNYTNIVSPVNGTVVSRNINVGQTVAASFSTPTLFLIANDLTKMQVDTNVSESDIAGLREGSPASFTVAAYPRRVFHGVVAQVRIDPISVQNVITYDVVIAVANPDLLLRPGMTATARILKARAQDVLRVPSQALRFTPAGRTKPSGDSRVLWVLRDGRATPVAVKVGLDDGAMTQILSGALKPGDRVITAQAMAPRAAQPPARSALRF